MLVRTARAYLTHLRCMVLEICYRDEDGAWVTDITLSTI